MQHPMVKGKFMKNVITDFEGEKLLGKTEDMKRE
jgi:hypothetical protein